MGIPLANGLGGSTIPAGDQANLVVTGAFSGTGQSLGGTFWGAFNLAIWNTGLGASNSTVQLEKTFDGGTTWLPAGIGGAGQQAVYVNVGALAIVVSEPEKGVSYRLNCTAYVSGTLNYRMSASGPAALAWAVGVPSG